ncbi:MAG: DNA methyltransferase, partial [Nanoarchaeota archaeon]
EHHPSSMHPKLARALINLTGIEKGKLYDPFCGSGGILIEAGFMGLEPVGYDIDEEMLRKAKKNLEFYKIKKFAIKKQDATKINHKIDFLATDVPYGRGTKKINCEELYLKFLLNLKKILRGRAVIMFPHFVNYKKLIKKAKLKIKKEFSIYVHHDLTRKIAVVEKR